MYTDELSKFLHHHLNLFYTQHGTDIQDEDRVHELIDEYVTQDTLFFIKSVNDMIKYLPDYNFIHAIEMRMSENDYRDLLILADDAMSDVVWDYLISNY